MSTKWTMITGASEGLGVEFARLAAAEGRDLILVARQAQKLERLADELRAKHNVAIEVLPTDLEDPKAVEALWRRAEMRRHIDILVNNAGLGYNGPFTGADFTREMASIMVNVTALTTLTKRAVAHMTRQGGGRILNVGSAAGFMPGPNMAVYHATKAYVLSLTEAVAEELRGGPVTVTALCPGATATNFAKDAQMEGIALFKALPPASAKRVAKAGWKAMKKGKRIRVTGLQNKFFAFAPRFAPRFLVPRIAALFLK
ncbi:SDR family oxidoreductase [Defluviimonas sp. WL0050]|uniref:SDR family oxidoreductase n=1 Tax=Albidovulum litorale TaxID=2984134 RepID=A0ABT2ZIY9_9RHOB|nr:SDR family oxidoreductase [Defluviimonas sp. WL0050]MCV2871089.1 SDR family oxidoreductase [Defluviimonas sp. WL0050]